MSLGFALPSRPCSAGSLLLKSWEHRAMAPFLLSQELMGEALPSEYPVDSPATEGAGLFWRGPRPGHLRVS